MGRRDEVLDAALAVLGEQGTRHLTHRAVDERAGLPTGSTSNYFRTRDALLAGAVERVSARERAAWEVVAATFRPASRQELAAALAGYLQQAVTVDRTATLARIALFGEAALRPELLEHLRPAAADIRVWASRWLRDVGSSDPERDCRIVLNQVEGILIHQLTFAEPDFDPFPELELVLRAL